MCEAQSEFRGGWGDLEKFPSMGEVWIFSGTTHYFDGGIVYDISYMY